MLQKIFKAFTAISMAVILFSPASVLALSASQKAVCAGAGGSDMGSYCATSGPSAPSVAQKAVIVFSVVIGFIAVVMLMIGGVKYMTSQGDPQSISSAKNTILYAIVGILVAAMAQGIAKYVINQVQ